MRVILFAICSFILNVVYAQNEILGKWYTKNEVSIVDIKKVGVKYQGTIIHISSKAKSKVDEHNPDDSLRNRSMVGVVILKDMIYKNNKWKGGTIYNPTNGKTYKCKIWIGVSGELYVRGYLGLFYRTQIWNRVE